MKKRWRNAHYRSSWLETIKRTAVAFIFVGIALTNHSCGDPPPEQEGGREVDGTNLRDNEGVLSPPTIVPPLLRCGESVTVKGFVSGARIRIYVGGSELAADVGWFPDGHTVRLPRQLAEHEIVTATQQVSGSVESGRSPEVRVVDYLAAFPSGLPQPRLPYLPLYNCGVATVVDQLPPGGKVTVFDQVNRGDPRTILGSINGVAAGQSIGVGPPFVQNHWVSAQSEICGVPSIFSTEHQVQAAPTTIPAPQVTGLYENGGIITVNQLVNGARVTISAGGSTIGGGGAPAEHVTFGLSRALINGERVDITQELCPGTIGTGGGTVLPCSSLPAPRIAAPWQGDDVIRVIDPVPGSRIRVYVDGTEIGDGGGTEIRLIRPLVDGEEVIVIQSLGGCTARMGWRVRVGRGLDDPTASGPCSNPEPFEYGHLNDGGRRTTDVSAYFDMPSSDVTVRMNAVPLHGVARVPRGAGPFPLVLIVHGNHIPPTELSYPGYDYLLDLLASHCMIAVSVEEDFLNGRVSGEMDARGIVLLRHLQLWREWNQTPGHRFFGKVDMNRIGLAGHSRGGEAIVAAHLLNVRDHRPAEPPQNFGFNIKALFSIAPVDGQFDGGAITLQGGADYYSMHGSHDGDVFNFGGLRMYNRAYPVTNPTSNTKGFVFVHGADHSQWNTTWCCDSGGLASLPFPVIARSDQEQIGKAYMSAFFQMSLRGNVGYKHFLNGDAGFASLPAAVTRVFQYQDPERTFINHYQEDNNTATGSLMGATNSASSTFASHSNLSFGQENAPDFLWGETNGLLLKWEGSANPEYRVNVADRLNALPNYQYLAFHAGQTHEEPRRFNDPSANQDFSVQLQFGGTAGPEVMVSSYALLRYPALTGSWFGGRNSKKSILRTVRIPFADLRPDPRLRLRDVTEIVFRFNRRASGSIAIDEIQFTQ